MKRIIISLIVGGLLGGFVGFAAGIFVYPYIFLADIVATEDIGDVSARQLVARGAFIHANPSDPIHYGQGGVRVCADAVDLQRYPNAVVWCQRFGVLVSPAKLDFL